MSFEEIKFNKILIISCRQIGDVLLTTPLIDRVADFWPNAIIDFLGISGTVEILAGHPYLNECIGVKRRLNWMEYFLLLKKITNQYDLSIVTQSNDRSYLYGLLAAPYRIGVCNPGFEDKGWKRWISKFQVPVDSVNQHAVTEKLNLLDPFEKLPRDSHLIAVTPPAAELLPESIKLPEWYVVIHPTPLNAYKRWPTENWASLIEFITASGMPIVVSGGPGEADAELRDELLGSLSPQAQSMVWDTTGQLQFGQLSALLQRASAYIGIDTSITHLAAACNIPTIAIFGPTPPTNFGPWPNGFSGSQPYQLKVLSQTVRNVTILQGAGSCVPCRKSGCEDTPNSSSRCLDELSPERVIAAYEALSL
jgi:heptosyltransferase-3